MVCHYLSLNSPWFEYAKLGRKKYEGRRNTEKVRSICVGNTIEFRHHTDDTREAFTVVVEEILHFPTFRDALAALPIDEVLPNETCLSYTIDDADVIYQRYVSIATQRKDGVVMMKLALLDAEELVESS